MTNAVPPRDVLQQQVAALLKLRPDLRAGVTAERRGENLPNGEATRRIDVTITLNGNEIEVATIEYPEEEPGYPALIITGDEPFWRYNHAYDPDELVDVLKHELSRDDRLTA
jgi:hypothetical protein